MPLRNDDDDDDDDDDGDNVVCCCISAASNCTSPERRDPLRRFSQKFLPSELLIASPDLITASTPLPLPGTRTRSISNGYIDLCVSN
jgi:hypothetical protein